MGHILYHKVTRVDSSLPAPLGNGTYIYNGAAEMPSASSLLQTSPAWNTKYVLDLATRQVKGFGVNESAHLWRQKPNIHVVKTTVEAWCCS